jgi:hypothetical protein
MPIYVVGIWPFNPLMWKENVEAEHKSYLRESLGKRFLISSPNDKREMEPSMNFLSLTFSYLITIRRESSKGNHYPSREVSRLSTLNLEHREHYTYLYIRVEYAAGRDNYKQI